MLRKPAPKPVVAAMAGLVALIWLVVVASGQITPFSKVKLKWRCGRPGQLMSAGCDAAGNSYLLFGDPRARAIPSTLYKLNSTGGEEWRVELPALKDGGWEYLTVAPAGRTAVGGVIDPHVACIGPDGQLAWEKTLPVTIGSAVQPLCWSESGDLAIRVWPTHEEVFWLDAQGEVLQHAASSEMVEPVAGVTGDAYFAAKMIASFGGSVKRNAELWDVYRVTAQAEAERFAGTGQDEAIHQLAVGADGSVYVVHSAGIVRLGQDGRELARRSTGWGEFDTLYINGAQACLVSDAEIELLDPLTLAARWTCPVQGEIAAMAISQDGTAYCLVEREQREMQLILQLKQLLNLPQGDAGITDLIVIDHSGKILAKQQGTLLRGLAGVAGGSTVLAHTEAGAVWAIAH
jgi:hypothetical protein